jgi:hypothetical protein
MAAPSGSATSWKRTPSVTQKEVDEARKHLEMLEKQIREQTGGTSENETPRP